MVRKRTAIECRVTNSVVKEYFIITWCLDFYYEGVGLTDKRRHNSCKHINYPSPPSTIDC